MSTFNRLDLQTLGSQPIMKPKDLPDHWQSLGVVTRPWRKENEEKEEPIFQDSFSMEKGVTPLLLWPVENGEWELPVSQVVVRIYVMFTRSDYFGVFNTNEMQKVAWCINLPGGKQKLCGKTFAQEVFSILHSPPSAFQGERATSPRAIATADTKSRILPYLGNIRYMRLIQ